MTSTNILTNIVCPVIGTFICNVMWLSPMYAVLEAREKHMLGDMNPFPFGVIVVNCMGWVGYGVIRQDYFIFFSNSCGLVLGIFYSISSLAILYKPTMTPDESLTHFYLEMLLCNAFILWLSVFLIIGITFSSTNGTIVGYICSACGVMYYAAPLSVIRKVIETKNSKSLYMPTIITNVLNTLMWVIYGWFGIDDPVVYGPNLAGLFLSLSQLGLIVVYSNKECDTEADYKTSSVNYGAADMLET